MKTLLYMFDTVIKFLQNFIERNVEKTVLLSKFFNEFSIFVMVYGKYRRGSLYNIFICLLPTLNSIPAISH